LGGEGAVVFLYVVGLIQSAVAVVLEAVGFDLVVVVVAAPPDRADVTAFLRNAAHACGNGEIA
jgi:hypothetical protein